MRELSALIDRYSEVMNADIERQDYRTALICAVLANINRDPKAKPEPFNPKDFMPSYSQETERKTVEEKEELDYLLELATNLGAEVNVHG